MCVYQVSTDGTGSRRQTGHSNNGQTSATFTFSSANGSSSLADETLEGWRHVHDNSKYTCQLCVSEFNDLNQWLHHVTTIHDSRQYVCPECQRLYFSKSGLRDHVYKKHRKVTRYRCETCGKGFFCRSVYHDHIAAHAGVKRHTCSICYMKFMNKSTLKKHGLHFHPKEAANIL